MRFIARIDDGALESRLQPDLHLKEVGPLRQLKACRPPVLSDTHSPGPSKDLSSDEQRNQVTHEV